MVSPLDRDASALPPQEQSGLITAKSPPEVHYSLQRAILLAVSSVLLSCAGALMAQYPSEGSPLYFYFVLVPWISAFFQWMAYAAVQTLLRESVTALEYAVQIAVRGMLACLVNCLGTVYAVLFALRGADGEFRVFSLLFVLGLDVLIAGFSLKWKVTAKRVFAVTVLLIPLFQLYYSIIYGTTLLKLPVNQKYLILVCYTYPIAMGLFKMGMQGTE